MKTETKVRLLVNNATPYAITIYQNQIYSYFTKADRGKFWEYRVLVAMKRPELDTLEKPDNLETNENLKWIRNTFIQYDKGLGALEKIFIRFRRENAKGGINDFKYVDEKRVGVSGSYTVLHYPHVIGFKRGTSMRDEKEYNILVNSDGSKLAPTKIENDAHADDLLETFGFVDEVDEKGVIVTGDRIQTGRDISKNVPDYRGRPTPTAFEQVPHTQNPGRPINAPDRTQPNWEK